MRLRSRESCLILSLSDTESFRSSHWPWRDSHTRLASSRAFLGICFLKRPGIVCHSSISRRPRTKRGEAGDRRRGGISGYKLGVCVDGLCGQRCVVGIRERASRHSKIQCLRNGLRFLWKRRVMGLSLVCFLFQGEPVQNRG